MGNITRFVRVGLLLVLFGGVLGVSAQAQTTVTGPSVVTPGNRFNAVVDGVPGNWSTGSTLWDATGSAGWSSAWNIDGGWGVQVLNGNTRINYNNMPTPAQAQTVTYHFWGWNAQVSAHAFDVYLSVTVGTPPPTSSFTVTPTTGRKPLAVTTTFTGQYATLVTWSWGDGSANTTGNTGAHAYTNQGTYTITCTASSSNGSATSTHSVEVTIPPVMGGNDAAIDYVTPTIAAGNVLKSYIVAAIIGVVLIGAMIVAWWLFKRYIRSFAG